MIFSNYFIETTQWRCFSRLTFSYMEFRLYFIFVYQCRFNVIIIFLSWRQL